MMIERSLGVYGPNRNIKNEFKYVSVVVHQGVTCKKVRYVAEGMDWTLKKFRGFRCRNPKSQLWYVYGSDKVSGD